MFLKEILMQNDYNKIILKCFLISSKEIFNKNNNFNLEKFVVQIIKL